MFELLSEVEDEVAGSNHCPIASGGYSSIGVAVERIRVQRAIVAVRCDAKASGLHRHVGTDRRCQPDCRAAPAQQRAREAGDQRRPHPEGLEASPPSCARRTDARWTVKFTKAKPRDDGSMPPVDLAIPLFGYQNHVSIDRGFGFIRRWTATDAAAYEGRHLREGLLDKSNTASGVWADTAYRSAANEAFLIGFVSHIHRKKPKGRIMPEATRRANNAKSTIRSRIEHVFAEQKERMDLFIRTVGIARATTKIGLANLVYNIKRLIFLRRAVVA